LLQAASVLPAMMGAGGWTVPSAATTRDAALATGWQSTAALAVMVAVAAVPAMANGAVAGTTASAPIAAADAALAVLVTPAASATTATPKTAAPRARAATSLISFTIASMVSTAFSAASSPA
jgi:hypothetical protein